MNDQGPRPPLAGRVDQRGKPGPLKVSTMQHKPRIPGGLER
jgi:hypothetical protein